MFAQDTSITLTASHCFAWLGAIAGKTSDLFYRLTNSCIRYSFLENGGVSPLGGASNWTTTQLCHTIVADLRGQIQYNSL